MSTTIERASEQLLPETPTTRPRRAFIKRHALSIYYALAFAISWGGFLLVLGPDGFFATGSDIAGAGALAIAGPAIAGVLMTGLVDGRAGLRGLVSRLRRWRVGARWYAVALAPNRPARDGRDGVRPVPSCRVTSALTSSRPTTN